LSEKDISPEKKTVNNDDDDGSLHRKPLEEEVKATVEQTTPVKSECDSSMNVSSVNEESVLLLQTPQKAEKCTDNNDKDDDVEMKCEIDSTLMPCGSGTKCRTCPYDGPNILRHFQAIHGWQAKKCRKCTHFWEKKSFEEHPCSGKVYDFTSDNVVCVPQKKVAAIKKVVVDPIRMMTMNWIRKSWHQCSRLLPNEIFKLRLSSTPGDTVTSSVSSVPRSCPKIVRVFQR
jgi:ribosomal protein L40E